MLKMQTIGGIFVIFDRGRIIKFKKSIDAWQYIFIVRSYRDKVNMGPRSLYPVRSLNPFPERKEKRVVYK